MSQSHRIPSHPIASQRIPTHPIASQRIPTHPNIHPHILSFQLPCNSFYLFFILTTFHLRDIHHNNQFNHIQILRNSWSNEAKLMIYSNTNLATCHNTRSYVSAQSRGHCIKSRGHCGQSRDTALSHVTIAFSHVTIAFSHVTIAFSHATSHTIAYHRIPLHPTFIHPSSHSNQY
jgi:hypothetical protein